MSDSHMRILKIKILSYHINIVNIKFNIFITSQPLDILKFYSNP